MSETLLPIPKTYLEKLLKPVSRLTESCILKVSKDTLYTVCTPADNSLILYFSAVSKSPSLVLKFASKP